MPIKYRMQKGAPLTIEELDNNFRELEERLNALESQDNLSRSIGKITLEGRALIFEDLSGDIISHITIPLPTIVPRGAWTSDVQYTVGDLVVFESCAYVCQINHQSTNFTSERHNWHLFLSFDSLKGESLRPEQSVAAHPQIPSHLAVYETNTLPQPDIGQVALLMEEDGEVYLVFSDGKNWRKLTKNTKDKEEEK